MDTPILGISANHNGDSEASLVLFEPSNKAYTEVAERLAGTSYSETDFLQNIPMMTDFAEDQIHLVARTSALRLENEQFDADEFLEMTGYIHVSDPDLPGPEYDFLKDKVSSARPDSTEARMAWEKSYEVFRQQRIEDCGLDLEPFEPS